MMVRWVGAVLALVALCSGGAHAETAEEAAALFGARPGVLDVSLSPSGSRLAYLAPGDHSTEIVYVVELGAPGLVPRPVVYFDAPTSEITDCSWATEEQLVCQAYHIEDVDGRPLSFTRMFSVSADGQDTRLLTARASYRALGLRQNGGSIVALDVEGEPGSILMTRDWVPESSAGTLIANNREGLGVDSIDIATGRRRVSEPADRDAVHYVADQNGRVRLKVRQPRSGTGNLGDRELYFARQADSDRWEMLSQTRINAQTSTGFAPVAIDSDLNVVYGFDDQQGRTSLYSLRLDAGGERELVLAHEQVDVDSLIRIGRQRRVVGASYATERREISYIDDELAALASSLGAALPDKPLVNIVDASGDESKLLIIAASDTDPGMVYLYDKSTRTLGELIPMRGALEGRAMAPMEAVSFPAGDGTMIPGYLTLPPGAQRGQHPAIVLPHGGPSARDEWGFDWLVQFFAARGYAVLQPNYRGSAGYGRDWFGENGFQAWRIAVGDVNDAGRWLVREGIADPARLGIVGWSYGGYAALQSQVLDNDLFQAVVAIAPVADLDRLKSESNRFTSAALVSAFVGEGPHIAEGSPARNAAAFQAPVLLFHGSNDLNVAIGQSRLMRDRLIDTGKQVELIEYDQRDHYIDDQQARADMLTRIDTFLEREL